MTAGHLPRRRTTCRSIRRGPDPGRAAGRQTRTGTPTGLRSSSPTATGCAVISRFGDWEATGWWEAGPLGYSRQSQAGRLKEGTGQPPDASKAFRAACSSTFMKKTGRDEDTRGDGQASRHATPGCLTPEGLSTMAPTPLSPLRGARAAAGASARREFSRHRSSPSRPVPPPRPQRRTLAPQPPLLEPEDADLGENVHQVAVAEPAVLAGAVPPPAGRGPVPVLLPRLPLLTDQAAGDGRCHGCSPVRPRRPAPRRAGGRAAAAAVVGRSAPAGTHPRGRGSLLRPEGEAAAGQPLLAPRPEGAAAAAAAAAGGHLRGAPPPLPPWGHT